MLPTYTHVVLASTREAISTSVKHLLEGELEFWLMRLHSPDFSDLTKFGKDMGLSKPENTVFACTCRDIIVMTSMFPWFSRYLYLPDPTKFGNDTDQSTTENVCMHTNMRTCLNTHAETLVMTGISPQLEIYIYFSNPTQFCWVLRFKFCDKS